MAKSCKPSSYALPHGLRYLLIDYYNLTPSRDKDGNLHLKLDFEVEIIVECGGSCPDIAGNACPMMPPGFVDISIDILGMSRTTLSDKEQKDLLDSYKRAKRNQHYIDPTFEKVMADVITDNADFYAAVDAAVDAKIQTAVDAALANAVYFDYCRCASAFSADYESAITHNKNFFLDYNKNTAKSKFY